MGDFSHLDAHGEAKMVDVSAKVATTRLALAQGKVQVSRGCAQQLTAAMSLEIARTARIAGIQAAKQTAHLIPLCHPLPLNGVDVRITFQAEEQSFFIEVTAKTSGPTGVEMEALTAASVAGLTIYDMVKAVDPAATVGPFHLQQKEGGKSGVWKRN